MTTPSQAPLGFLPQSTIVPRDESLFIPYLTRTYEQIAQVVNNKDGNYFPIAITSTATNIPFLSNFGAFIICVSGATSTLPTLTASLCKSNATTSGSIVPIGFQAGTGSWATYVLTITSTATNFQIAHNNTGITGNFNVRIIGTQGF